MKQRFGYFTKCNDKDYGEKMKHDDKSNHGSILTVPVEELDGSANSSKRSSRASLKSSKCPCFIASDVEISEQDYSKVR